MFLIAEDLWDVVTGDEIKVKRSTKAKTITYLMVDKTLCLVIKSSKPAKEIREKFEERHENK